MKGNVLIAGLCSLLTTFAGRAQRFDTTILPLTHKILENKFFLAATDRKIVLLDSFRQEIPEPPGGSIAVQYDALRGVIAMDYYKKGDTTRAEAWMAQVHTPFGKCKTGIDAGELLLKKDEKGQAPAVEARLRPLVDSVFALFIKSGAARDTCNMLMPVYTKTLLALGRYDRIVYYLQPLYEANGQKFASDMRTRTITRPEEYKLTDNLSYDLGLALASTGRSRDAIDIWARMYLSGDEVSPALQAGIKTECARLPGGEAYFQHITDSVRQFYHEKLAAFAASKHTADGKPIDFAALRGKYVLLDFWGSWCGPCRKSHPHLKELYAKYKDKGFEIIGIALEHAKTADECRTAWTRAIGEDGLTWMQVLDNEHIKQFNTVRSYGVTAFPTKILLDRDGNIIGRYVGGGNGSMAFTYKLEELLGK